MTVGVKDGPEEFRRVPGGMVSGPPGNRAGRYYLRPEYTLGPQHHHHHEAQRHDFPPREFLPQEKLDDLYPRHKEEFFANRPKEREDLPPPGGYGGPPTPDDPFTRNSANNRSVRMGERFPRIQDYPPPPNNPDNRAALYPGPNVPTGNNGSPNNNVPAAPNTGVPPNTVGQAGGERVSRLLELYGTLDNRTSSSRSHHDLYGSLDGRASRLSDIFPTSDNRIRQSEFRGEETRSLSGRESVLSDLYRRRELPPAPPEYRLHDYRPRHDFRGQNKTPAQHDQDVIENPMYDVDRRGGPPRTPGPRVATPTTTPNGSHHSHLAHMAHHTSSPTPGHHPHSAFHSGISATSGHSVGHTPTHPGNHVPSHPIGHPGAHSSVHPVNHPTGHSMVPSHSGGHAVPDRSEVRYTAAIAQQEDALRRIVPANRVEGQRSVNVPSSAICPNMASNPNRQGPPHQHNTLSHQQHSHLSSHSTQNNVMNASSSTVVPTSSPASHATTPNPSYARSVSLPLTSNNVTQATNSTSSFSKPISHHTLSRSLSRKEQLKKYMRKEAKEFFGLDDESELKQRQKWEDKRRRLASRKYGPLRDQSSHAYDTFPFAERNAQQDSLQVRSRTPQSFTRDFHALNNVPDSRSRSCLVDTPDASPWPKPPPARSKDSVAKMTWDGFSYVVSTISKRRAKSQSSSTPGGRSRSRSYAPSAVSITDEDEQDSTPTTTGTTNTTSATSNSRVTPIDQASADSLENEVFFDGKLAGSSEADRTGHNNFDNTKEAASSTSRYHPSIKGHWKLVDIVEQSTGAEATDSAGGRGSSRIGRTRIWRRILDHCFDNSDRRQYGMGLVGRYCNRSMNNEIVKEVDVRKQLDEMNDYRPYFTWWATTVQFFILFLSIMCYGFAPLGVSLRQNQGQVLMSSLSIQTVDYWEPENLWLGPRAADLIHLGAKFAPCMRKDEKIFRHIEEQRRAEKDTGCCIRNDDSGCVQSSKGECSERLSVWKKWGEVVKGPDGRLSGSVCGQDPNYCKEPASVPPHEWPDDITRWPICKRRVAVSPVRSINAAEHMACEVIGHPCCIGIHGECRITTREYCNFVRGYFHEEATLCAQVSCLNNVCGMIPFYSPDRPDQFYRLWTSLFIHAGIIHFVISFSLQYWVMRDLEKLAGPLRIGIIYMVSGVAGNLASAIFVPYRAEVGPSGSQFGLLACLFVEVINCWPMIRYPWKALLRLVGITFLLFGVGLLPWVDNYAHIFGFIFGFLLSYALLPYVSFGPYDRRRKVLLIWVCLVAVVVMLSALIILFYVTPIYECKICEYLNCIPLTRDFCAEQNINLDKKRDLI